MPPVPQSTQTPPVDLWGAPVLGSGTHEESGFVADGPRFIDDPWLLTTLRYDSSSDRTWDFEVHSEHELLWSGAGKVSLEANQTLWMVPPTLGIWIPSGVPHRVHAEPGSVTYATYIKPEEHTPEWNTVSGIGMPAVLRELMLANQTQVMPDDARLLMQRLTLKLISPVVSTSLNLKMPTSPAIRALAQQILDNPADDRTTEAWASAMGMSSKTLTRIFDRECGLSLTQWRIMARVRTGLIEISSGRAVATVAARLGYANPSTFIEVFKQVTGHTPAAYFRSISRESDGISPVVQEVNPDPFVQLPA